MTDAKIAPRCAWCGKGDKTAVLTAPDKLDPDRLPQENDACLCVACGAWSMWDGKLGRLRKPDKEEARMLAESAHATMLKVQWLLWRMERKKKAAKRLPEKQLLDIRSHAIERVNVVLHDASQLVDHPMEVLEIIAGVALSVITKAAITYGSRDMTMTGTEAITKVLEIIATACAECEVDQDVDASLAALRAQLAARGLTSGWPE